MSRIVPVCLVLMLLFGCSSGEIDVVRDGTMLGYPNTTLGKALEASFSGTSWETGTTSKGAATVTFSGKITRQLHAQALEDLFRKLGFESIGKGTSLSNASHAARQVINTYMDKGSYASKIKSVQAKFDAAYKMANNESTPENNQALERIREEWHIAHIEICKDFLDEEYWPTSDKVSFTWVLSQDKTNFQLNEYANDSWAKFRVRSDDVFRIIYLD